MKNDGIGIEQKNDKNKNTRTRAPISRQDFSRAPQSSSQAKPNSTTETKYKPPKT